MKSEHSHPNKPCARVKYINGQLSVFHLPPHPDQVACPQPCPDHHPRPHHPDTDNESILAAIKQHLVPEFSTLELQYDKFNRLADIDHLHLLMDPPATS